MVSAPQLTSVYHHEDTGNIQKKNENTKCGAIYKTVAHKRGSLAFGDDYPFDFHRHSYGL